jgi:nitrogen fixation/metabolism regulation signal transduction histidine kinase
MHEKRTKIWIDRFQTVLFWRIAFYFVFYQVAVWAVVAIEWNIYNTVADLLGAEFATRVIWFLSAFVVVVGILFIYDAVAFAHRIVGPLVRFRRVCQAVRDGEPVDLVKLRKGDFLQEFRDEFNDMLRALEQRGALTLHGAEEKTPEAERTETHVNG